MAHCRVEEHVHPTSLVSSDQTQLLGRIPQFQVLTHYDHGGAITSGQTYTAANRTPFYLSDYANELLLFNRSKVCFREPRWPKI